MSKRRDLPSVNQQGDVATVSNDEIAEYVADLMSAGWYKHSLKAKLEEELGSTPISMTVFEWLCRRAEHFIRERAAMTINEHRAHSLAFYAQIMRDESVKPGVRLAAREKMDKILGLQHMVLEVSDPASKAAAIRTALEQMNATFSGQSEDAGSAEREGDIGADSGSGDEASESDSEDET